MVKKKRYCASYYWKGDINENWACASKVIHTFVYSNSMLQFVIGTILSAFKRLSECAT